MKKIAKIIAGVALAASMLSFAGCSMLVTMVTGKVFEEKGSSISFEDNSYLKNNETKNNMIIDFDENFKLKKGKEYIATLTGTMTSDVNWWLGIHAWGDEEILEWVPFCTKETDAVYGDSDFDNANVVGSYTAGEEFTVYARLRASKSGKANTVQISYGESDDPMGDNTAIKNYKLTIEEAD